MRLTVTTWNINSVRLRLPLALHLLTERRPDVLCLQETKTPNDRFPAKAFADAGYPHQAIIGAKGYNGVAIISRVPFAAQETMAMCGRDDARHVAVTLGGDTAAAGVTIHNFYVPAGGDEPDVTINDKFAHKLDFLAAMDAWAQTARPTTGRSVLVGDLNIAPYEHDVWSHKQLLGVVSHTPVETSGLERLRATHAWIDAVRTLRPEPEKLYTWWSYRAQDWAAADRGRRLDHIWVSPLLAAQMASIDIWREARGWERPSDHVPVSLSLDLSR